MASLAAKITREYRKREVEFADLTSKTAVVRERIKAIADNIKEVEGNTHSLRVETDRIFEQGKKFQNAISAMEHEVIVLQNKLATEKAEIGALDRQFEIERDTTLRHNKSIDDAKESIRKLVDRRDRLYDEIRVLTDERNELLQGRRDASERHVRESTANSKYEQAVLAMSMKVQI